MTKFKKAIATLTAVVSAASALCVPMAVSADSETDNSSSISMYTLASVNGIYYNTADSSSHLSFGTYGCTATHVTADDGTVVSITTAPYTWIDSNTIEISLPTGGYVNESGTSDYARTITGTVSGRKITTFAGEEYKRPFI